MSTDLSSVRVAGGLLPPDVLSAVLAGQLDGLTSNDYHLGGESPREAAAREWTHLLGVYRRFRDDLARLPEGDPAVGLTRERWLTQLFSALDYGRVPVTGPGGIATDDQQYPVSHLWGSTPMHLLGWGVPLDKRTPGVAGAAQRAPHAMLQELLNRSDDYLWGVVANGALLRLLRDSTTLTGQSYVEFDLETMFDGELFADFALLYLLVHQSRVEIPEGGQQIDSWLEKWRTTAVSQGVRAMALLRDGVQEALQTLGTGFLQHPANVKLRNQLDDGTVTLDELHQNLLRIVYRLLFWAVAEDRDAVLDPHADPAAAARYRDYYSSSRLRRLALRRHGSAHHDLWDGVGVVLTALGRLGGEPRLALPGLGGLFNSTQADVLEGSRLGNQFLLAAVRSLSVVQPKGQPRRIVDFRHLGAEELGSIYESLLELVPRRDPVTHTFSLEDAAGNDRKTSGSYYTPTELVDLVLDTALDPVLDEAEKQGTTADEKAAALLGVTVCDPAIGSGHFMVAAARRIAARLATVRTGEIDPTPTTFTEAMHDVVARCIYGVDINPMAADLAKVSLWLEAMSPGRPLSFLDHHIKVGNALLGTTPALLHAGIPDAAYTALTGDDKPTVTAWRKLNEKQRAGQTSLFDEGGLEVGNAIERAGIEEISQRSSAARTLADVAWAAQRYATMQIDARVVRDRRVADAWCAAFLVPKTPGAEPITHATLAQLEADTASQRTIAAVETAADQHRLFHWHLEFPDVLRVPDHLPAATSTGWTGGFDAMLGNPPWEALQMSEKEFFSRREPSISAARTASERKKMIAGLAVSSPQLFGAFNFELRRGAAETHLIRAGGRYPLCATGKINTYSIFAEQFRACLSPSGRVGILTPTGLATGDTTSAFFSDILRSGCLVAFYDFANHKRGIFPDLKGQSWFGLTVLTGGSRVERAVFASDLEWPDEVKSQSFSLALSEILETNPNTGTLPIFKGRRDADITLQCYRRAPILVSEEDGGNAWGLRFSQGLFNMSTDSEHFRTADDLEAIGARFDGWGWQSDHARWLPLYEGKMVSAFNDRFGDFSTFIRTPGRDVRAIPTPSDAQLDDPNFSTSARYWIESKLVDLALEGRWSRDWLFGWRDITNTTNVRTFVPGLLPRSAVGHVFPIAMPSKSELVPLLQAIWSSLAFDYIARQKLSGTHMTYSVVNQLPCPNPEYLQEVMPWLGETAAHFVFPRVFELTYTSSRLLPYAADLCRSDPGTPFRWVTERRERIIAELDAAIFHVYGLVRGDVEHILDSFSKLRRNDERDHGSFRTREFVLAEYDAMTRASETGVPYRSPLDPPPGEGPRHPARTT